MEKKGLIEHLKIEGFSFQILKAFEKVPREKFIPENLENYAYEDTALPLESGATISQPYTIAFMLNLLELKRGQKILEIGSGCGYVLALLFEIAKGEVYGIEIIKSLAEKSKSVLLKLGYKKIKLIQGNGFLGLKEKAPFDRILISAAAGEIPKHLFSQLKANGILVVPVENSIFQIKKIRGKVEVGESPGFVFVPLVK